MSAAPEEEDTTLPPDSIVEAEVGLIPESLDADVDSLLRSWHVQYFTKRDDYCHDDEENVYFPDSVYADRLSRLPAMIPLPYNNVVRDCIDLYTERRRGLVRYMLGMADYYFPIIEKILDKHGLPLELKYLAVVESALNPVALSRVGACGLWQFMLPTGKQYGLTINSLVDDRRDPVKATEAACEYFKDMYAIYKDWSLVMASYNCGPGNVNKAIKRSGGKTNFWDIFPYLPRETRSYVPLFIAANYVMNYYCDHNLCPLETDIPLATDTIHVHKILHLQQVADVLHVDIAQLRALNPQYKRDIVPGNTTESVLKLPAAQTYAFIDHEDSIYAYRKAELLPDGSVNVSLRGPAPFIISYHQAFFVDGKLKVNRPIQKFNELNYYPGIQVTFPRIGKTFTVRNASLNSMEAETDLRKAGVQDGDWFYFHAIAPGQKVSIPRFASQRFEE